MKFLFTNEDLKNTKHFINALKSQMSEYTDKEQRAFLSAMKKEMYPRREATGSENKYQTHVRNFIAADPLKYKDMKWSEMQKIARESYYNPELRPY